MTLPYLSGQTLRSWGIPDEVHRVVRAAQIGLAERGMSARQFEGLVRHMASSSAETPEQFQAEVNAYCATTDISAKLTSAPMAWLQEAAERGLDNVPGGALPTREQVDAELAQIREQRRADPDRYEDPATSEREIDLLELKLAAPAVTPGNEAAPAIAPNAARLAEIRQRRRDDPNWFDPKVEAEEIRLIEAGMQRNEPAPQPAQQPSQEAPSAQSQAD